jgi:two-component system chemotaxis family response regulator WspR
MLLPGATMQDALAVAGEVHRAVEELCIAHASSPCGQVTVSVGVAAMVPGVGEEAELLVEAADLGLYAAKRRGRNAVAAHDPVMLAEAS